jgi:hypothetical protein
VYEPSASAAADTDHEAPERVAERVCTVVAPCFTTTLTVAESPLAVPAVPEIEGDELLVELPSTGLTTATPEGATVSIENVLTVELEEFPAASDWVA